MLLFCTAANESVLPNLSYTIQFNTVDTFVWAGVVNLFHTSSRTARLCLDEKLLMTWCWSLAISRMLMSEAVGYSQWLIECLQLSALLLFIGLLLSPRTFSHYWTLSPSLDFYSVIGISPSLDSLSLDFQNILRQWEHCFKTVWEGLGKGIGWFLSLKLHAELQRVFLETRIWTV